MGINEMVETRGLDHIRTVENAAKIAERKETKCEANRCQRFETRISIIRYSERTNKPQTTCLLH